MRIYVASSWRNMRQPKVVAALQRAGHEVYDFRNPGPGKRGFGWREVQPEPPPWTPEQYADALRHPRAQEGFALDHAAMEWADAFVLVLPCGRSAHLELGWACGKGKRAYILLEERVDEPELMYLEVVSVGGALATDVSHLLLLLKLADEALPVAESICPKCQQAGCDPTCERVYVREQAVTRG